MSREKIGEMLSEQYPIVKELLQHCGDNINNGIPSAVHMTWIRSALCNKDPQVCPVVFFNGMNHFQMVLLLLMDPVVVLPIHKDSMTLKEAKQHYGLYKNHRSKFLCQYIKSYMSYLVSKAVTRQNEHQEDV